MDEEKISDEELQKLVLEAQKEALENEENTQAKHKKRFPKLIVWFVTICLLLNTVAFLPEKFSLPAIKFLKTSARLSQQSDIQQYKQAVVAIASGDSRGTGFSISNDGTIITNDHVIGDHEKVIVSFPEQGPHSAQVVQRYPAIDLAILQIEKAKDDFPYLTLAKTASAPQGSEVVFIGNPLRFHGIVNEGTIIDTIKLHSWEDEVIMIQAPIYRGNSGSPVINQEGEVIGVIFATLDHDKHGKVGLFVPVELYYKHLD